MRRDSPHRSAPCTPPAPASGRSGFQSYVSMDEDVSVTEERLSVTEEVRLDDLEMHNIVSTG
jgi:hypothetical protein